jgi:histidyl-tRNA synthetase
MKNLPLYQTPRGMADRLPREAKYWRKIEEAVTSLAECYGFERIETPTVEYKDIFAKGVGETTDIVAHQMFLVSRPGDQDETREMVLRPEYTAGIARAYIQHGMQTWPQPVQLYYIGQLFRAERPQKGRYRQFSQFGFEILGDTSPMSDALVILLSWQILISLGVSKKLILEINSIGCEKCRGKIKKTLQTFFLQYQGKLCQSCQSRIATNPLRILDCKNESCQKINSATPVIVDQLCEECKNHFKGLLEYLDELSIPYDLNPKLVRGLDYYTQTVFEFKDPKDTASQSSLGGGGRYDELVKLFGEQDTPATGVSFGIERIVEKMAENKVKIKEKDKCQIVIVQLGEKAKQKGLALLAVLNETGITARSVLGKESLRSQLKVADKLGAPYAIIIGQKEALDKSVILRDMKTGDQESVEIDALETILKLKLGK